MTRRMARRERCAAALVTLCSLLPLLLHPLLPLHPAAVPFCSA